MTDKYIKNSIRKAFNYIDSKNYYLAGKIFIEISRYAIIINDKELTFIGSELADVYRSCFLRINEYEKKIDIGTVNSIIEKTKNLMNCFFDKERPLLPEDKIDIFDMLVYIIYNAEKIQSITEEFEDEKGIRRRVIL